MRKTVKFALCLLLAVAMVCLPVMASDSSTYTVEIVKAEDENGEEVEYTVENTSIPLLTEEIAASLLNPAGYECTADQLKVLWQKDVSAPVLPVTFTFRVGGSAGRQLSSYHWTGTEWELIDVGVGTELESTFEDLSPIGIVIKLPEGSNSEETSPKTGVTAGIAAAGVLAVSAGSAVIFRKKED